MLGIPNRWRIHSAQEYFQVANGRLVSSSLSLHDPAWDYVTWHYGDNNEWYGAGWVKAGPQLPAEWLEYLVMLDSNGGLTSTAVSSEFSSGFPTTSGSGGMNKYLDFSADYALG